MRKFERDGSISAREFGRAHGEMFRHEIQMLADIRIYLCQKVGGIKDRDEVMRLAQKHVKGLRDFDPLLCDELEGIAEGAKTDTAAIVVLNHYTDLRDLGATQVKDEDGCSLIYAKTESGPVLAQTWDMHATAIPYVMMLKVPAALGGPAWVLTLTGCLGMTGFHQRGLGICINNLHSLDARVGVVWPALVRRVLRAETADIGKDLILSANVGSGHHYLVADRENAYGIETSGRLKKVVFEAKHNDVFVHTNHCLDAGVAAVSTVPVASTSHARYDRLVADLKKRPIKNGRDAYDRLASQDGFPNSLCTNQATPDNPHGPATCGALSIELSKSHALCVGGFPNGVEPDLFSLEHL